MAKKPTQAELARLRQSYLDKREMLLKGKVNSLEAQLFDKVYTKYLSALKTDNGMLINSLENQNIVNGLDKIYNQFNIQNNVPVIKSFFGDLNGIQGLNVKYFETIDEPAARASAPEVKEIIDNQLGLNPDGSIKKGGFGDKFINDTTAVKKIKKISMQAIVKNKPWTEFRNELKDYIQGKPKLAESGLLQQNYRTYAYDTYQKVDRQTQHEFGKKLKLKYFIYGGGLITSSRDMCVHYNGRILNAVEFAKLKPSDLPKSYRAPLPPNWKPLQDLGGYNCRHSVNWVADSFAKTVGPSYNEKASKRAQKFRASKKSQ